MYSLTPKYIYIYIYHTVQLPNTDARMSPVRVFQSAVNCTVQWKISISVLLYIFNNNLLGISRSFIHFFGGERQNSDLFFRISLYIFAFSSSFPNFKVALSLQYKTVMRILLLEIESPKKAHNH
jgi:hypothetical protein